MQVDEPSPPAQPCAARQRVASRFAEALALVGVELGRSVVANTLKPLDLDPPWSQRLLPGNSWVIRDGFPGARPLVESGDQIDDHGPWRKLARRLPPENVPTETEPLIPGLRGPFVMEGQAS